MTTDDAINLGLYQWQPGTLSSTVLRRILRDALADLWGDCYRRDAPRHQQYHMFREQLMSELLAATGLPMQVVKS